MSDISRQGAVKMRVVKKRRREQRHLPEGTEGAVSETYFVEVQQFDRMGRDEWNEAMLEGRLRRRVETVLEHGICDFLLPGDEGDLRFGGTLHNWETYNDLDEELEDWIVLQVLDINGIRIGEGEKALPDRIVGPTGIGPTGIGATGGEGGGELGNLPGSPTGSSEVSLPETSEQPALQKAP
jgi:hypothetical protein